MVGSSVKVPEIDQKALKFDKKHLKETEVHVGRNFMYITYKSPNKLKKKVNYITLNVISVFFKLLEIFIEKL